MIESRPVVCKHCGGPTGAADLVTNHSPFDPLVVSECGGCGAIVGVGPREW